ncbi:MAG: tetratricopeptide repeat protein [Deltaproteobacteria bacterium]|nr:tetratricopeptide repeat protein [Deltaproteobacteria bacterium]
MKAKVIIFGLILSIVPSMVSAAPFYMKIYQNAKTKFTQNKFTEARSLFIQVKEFAKEDGTYQHMIDFRIAQCYEGEGNLEKAVAHYEIYIGAEKFPAKGPHKADVEKKIADLKVKMKKTVNPNESLKTQLLKQIMEKSRKGDELLASGDYRTALEYFREISRLMRRTKTYKTIITLKIGKCYEGLKKYPLAIRYYDNYIKTATVEPDWPSKSEISARVKIIKSIQEKERLKNDITRMNTTSRNDFVNLERYRKLANRYFGRGNYTSARNYFTKFKALSMKMNRYEPRVDWYIAVTYDYQQKYTEAIKHYNIYLKNRGPSDNPAPSDVKDRIKSLKDYNTNQNTPDSGNNDPNKPDGVVGGTTTPNNSDPGTGPGPTGPGNPSDPFSSDGSLFTKWYFYVGVAVAVVVVGVVLNDLQTDSSAMNPGFAKAKPAGLTLIRF